MIQNVTHFPYNGYRHPHVVIQNNIFNNSKISTVVVCALTSNLTRAIAPGNVLLQKRETSLAKASAVNISQIITVNKSDLKGNIGQLSKQRILEIISGVELLMKPRDI